MVVWLQQVFWPQSSLLRKCAISSAMTHLNFFRRLSKPLKILMTYVVKITCSPWLLKWSSAGPVVEAVGTN